MSGNKVRIDDVEAIGETPKALHVIIDGEKHWIPKSQIDDDSEVWENGQEGTLVISEWFADKEKLV